jgi:hypothetical protein
MKLTTEKDEMLPRWEVAAADWVALLFFDHVNRFFTF